MSRTTPLRIVYTCYGGTHSSPIAAAIHLGRLPRNEIPTPRQLMDTPLFDKVEGDGRGRLVLAGTDRFGNDVYVVGRGKESVATIHNTIVSAWTLVGNHTVPIELFDTLQCVNILMRVGGYLSRGAGLIVLGRPLVIRGTRRAYPRLVRLVEQVEKRTNGLTHDPVG